MPVLTAYKISVHMLLKSIEIPKIEK